jgi:hypothetical protein
MQPVDAGDDVLVTFYCKDADSQTKELCETFYSTDRGTWVVQGKRRGEKVAAQLVGLADDETFVEMSASTVDLFVNKYVEERYGLDLSRAARGTAQGSA